MTKKTKKKGSITESVNRYQHILPDTAQTREEFAKRILINSGVDVTYMTQYGENMLMSCISDASSSDTSRIATADLMLHTHLIHIEDKDYAGNTALSHCAMHGTTKIAQFLISRYGADVNSKNNIGNTPLHMALLANNYDVARYFIESGADINAKSDDSASIFMEAIRCVVYHKEEGETEFFSKPLAIIAKLLTYDHLDLDHIYKDYSALHIVKHAGIDALSDMIDDFYLRQSSTKEKKISDKNATLHALLDSLQIIEEETLDRELIVDGIFAAIQLSEVSALTTLLENENVISQVSHFDDCDDIMKKWRSAANPSKKKKQLQKKIDAFTSTVRDIENSKKETISQEDETDMSYNVAAFELDDQSSTDMSNVKEEKIAQYDMWHSGEEFFNSLAQFRPQTKIQPKQLETKNMRNTSQSRS